MNLTELPVLEADFHKRLMANPKFCEALLIAAENSWGKLWLIGGSVCVRRRIVGEIGLLALRDKVVAVNDPIQATYRAERKKTTVEELVRKYAGELGFSFEDPGWMG